MRGLRKLCYITASFLRKIDLQVGPTLASPANVGCPQRKQYNTWNDFGPQLHGLLSSRQRCEVTELRSHSPRTVGIACASSATTMLRPQLASRNSRVPALWLCRGTDRST
jgi:hypothetical protein